MPERSISCHSIWGSSASSPVHTSICDRQLWWRPERGCHFHVTIFDGFFFVGGRGFATDVAETPAVEVFRVSREFGSPSCLATTALSRCAAVCPTSRLDRSCSSWRLVSELLPEIGLENCVMVATVDDSATVSSWDVGCTGLLKLADSAFPVVDKWLWLCRSVAKSSGL